MTNEKLQVKAKSLLSKRVTKDHLIQQCRLEKLLSLYNIIPHNYTIEAPEDKRKYIDSAEGPIPERIIFHGDFILTRKEDNNE